MTLETRVIALAQAIGTDVKALRLADGDLSSLTTTAKDNLVAAINEINAALSAAGVQIDDTAGNGDNTVVYSADKVFDLIEAAKQSVKDDLTNGAGAALDTLSELAAALGDNPNFATEITQNLNNRLRFDEAQPLTAAQKLQGCTNLGVGNYDHDFESDYTAAKA